MKRMLPVFAALLALAGGTAMSKSTTTLAWVVHGGGGGGGGSLPIVNVPPAIIASSNFAGTSASSSPITFTPLTATNSPSSWAISTQPCTNCLSIDNSGNVTGGTGAASLTSSFAGSSYSFAVTATNGSGTSSPQTLSFTMYKQDAALSASVGGTVVNADLVGAQFTVTVTGGTNFSATNIGPWARTVVPGDEFYVNGTDQSRTVATWNSGTHTGTLSGSVSNVTAQPASTVYAAAPPWKIAGVDYAIGIPAAVTLVPYTNAGALPGSCSINGSTNEVSCSGANLVFNGIDFSTSGGAWLYCPGCTGAIIENCKFDGQTPLNNDPVTLITFGANVTIINNDIAEGRTTPGGSFEIGALIGISGGAAIVEGNYFHNYENQVTNFLGASGNPITQTRFNYIDNDFVCSGCHMNYQQIDTVSLTPEFYGNTTHQYLNLGAEGPQFYSSTNGTMTVNSPIDCGNTMIAGPLSGGTMSNMNHGSTSSPGTTTTGSPNACNNYLDAIGTFDFSGVNSPFYSSTFGSPWIDNPANINMRTGAQWPWPP